MTADLTLLIPTHERPAYLKRILDYYRELPLQILVGDSSAAAYDEPLPGNVTYIHYPDAEFYEKMNLFVRRAATPYAVLCADDDFIAPGGMQAALAFLKDNPDYASATWSSLADEELDEEGTVASGNPYKRTWDVAEVAGGNYLFDVTVDVTWGESGSGSVTLKVQVTQ